MRSQIAIGTSAATIFALASATERWPERLPHYRYVRVLAREGSRRTLAMAAWRGWVPVAWVAEQVDDPLEPSIRFRHIGGLSRGMDVVWRFSPLADGTRVTIDHRLIYPVRPFGELLARYVVGAFFVEYIAAKTLARMKVLAERAR